MLAGMGTLDDVAVVVLLGAGLVGCYSKATAYDGKLTFAYASGLSVDNFVKPIAPGAKLDVVAFANGTENKLEIVEARSSRPGVVKIEAVAGRTLTLRGVTPGTADIEIKARDAAGQLLVDKMFFHVGKPATHRLRHTCTDKSEAAYVRGEDIDILHTMATTDKRPIIGYGWVPMKVAPASALELVADPQGGGFYRYRAAQTHPKLTLRSEVDGTELSMRVVDRGELRDAALDVTERMLVGGYGYAVATVSVGEVALCHQTSLTRARSLTPTTCQVTARLDDDPADENREQLAEIHALAFGECRYEVTLPELDGGRGVVLQGKTLIGRVQFPGEGATDAVTRWQVPSWTRVVVQPWWLATRVPLLIVGIIVWRAGRRRRQA